MIWCGCRMGVVLGVMMMVLAVSDVSAQSGTFTDSRDGKKYRTVSIGGKTWMAENLNYQTGKSWCYENNESNCQKYGRLYDWNTAMTVCPAPWRVPNNEDWGSLFLAVGGKLDEDGDWAIAGNMLKSKTGWRKNGKSKDKIGFSALPGGNGRTDGIFSDGYFSEIYDFGRWWSATEYDADNAWHWLMGYYREYVQKGYHDKTSTFFSVRCVR